MVDKMAMSLDEIIRSSRVPRIRGGRVRKPEGRAPMPIRNAGNADNPWKHDMYEDSEETFARPTGLLVSNLDFGVSDSDLKELFTEFESLKSATVRYDRSGRSLGSANVTFDNAEDATKALNRYDGVSLDGRTMHIKMIDSETRFRPADGARADNRRAFRDGGFRPDGRRFENRNRDANRSRGRRDGGRKRSPVPTAEQLDAELDEYVNQFK